MRTFLHFNPINKIRIDAREFQLLFLTTFLLLGIFALGWDAELDKYGILITSCLFFQWMAARLYHLPISSLKSALISSLGLCILVKADALWVYALISFVTICGKFIFRVKNKHFINPANFGIIATLLLTNRVWISPGQWGNMALLFFIVGCFGFIVTYKVSRVDLSLFFIGFFLLFEYCYQILFLGWPLDHLVQVFTNGGFLLFTFFMLTDPVSTPSHKIGRRLWVIGVAILSFILKEFYYVPSAPFWALFYFSLLTPLVNFLFSEKPFLWNSTSKIITLKNN